jgi:hypothetical protein
VLNTGLGNGLVFNTMAGRRRKNFIGVWIGDGGVRAVDDRARSEHVTRSEVVRRMLAFAAQRMPSGWQPAPTRPTPE